MKVEGAENLSVYQAIITDSKTGETQQSSGQRNLCKHCGNALWLWDPIWPELVHPLASAIDTELPVPPERTHIMVV